MSVIKVLILIIKAHSMHYYAFFNSMIKTRKTFLYSPTKDAKGPL